MTIARGIISPYKSKYNAIDDLLRFSGMWMVFAYHIAKNIDKKADPKPHKT